MLEFLESVKAWFASFVARFGYGAALGVFAVLLLLVAR